MFVINIKFKDQIISSLWWCPNCSSSNFYTIQLIVWYQLHEIYFSQKYVWFLVHKSIVFILSKFAISSRDKDKWLNIARFYLQFFLLLTKRILNGISLNCGYWFKCNNKRNNFMPLPERICFLISFSKYSLSVSSLRSV